VSESSPPTVLVEDLCWRRGEQSILSDINLHIEVGEVVGLMGPNGGGKSSLLLLIAGLMTPSSGRILIGGHAALELARARTGAVGLITANPGLYPLLTGRENLYFFGQLYGLTPQQTDQRLAELMVELDMGEALDQPVSGYSSGMAQKLSLGRALLMAPTLLLLDEPTSNLDPLSVQTIFSAIRGRVDEGLSVIFVSHDLNAIEQICDRAVLLAGRVVEQLAISRRAPCAPSPLAVAWRAALGEQ